MNESVQDGWSVPFLGGHRYMDTHTTSRGDSPPKILLETYRKMVLIRQADEQIRDAIRTGRIVAPYYSPRGQECVAAALGTVLRRDDYLVTTYRGLHDHLAKGVPLLDLIAEYAGRITGSCRGKGGPMHITHPDVGVMVTTGIVGGGIPIANGFALASQVAGDDRVTAVCFGDGASNIGAFHEALNLAGLWRLPVIFLCQNNRYAEHTRFENGTSVAQVADRAGSYGMPGVTVDGNNATALLNVLEEAVARARRGDGPTLVEAMTFRFEGHSFGDSGEYIPTEELEAARACDPFPRIEAELLARGETQESLAAIDAAASAQVATAFTTVLAAPWPSAEELTMHVYADGAAA